jgi:hypothetical protein
MSESAAMARVAAALRVQGGEPATAMQVARSVASTLDEIEHALSPILGQKGVLALRKRSVHLAGKLHPWLITAREDKPLDDPAILEATLSAQTSSDAAAGGAAILQSFYELLASLVGTSLTERLLRTVWLQFLDAPPSQDSQ